VVIIKRTVVLIFELLDLKRKRWAWSYSKTSNWLDR